MTDTAFDPDDHHNDTPRGAAMLAALERWNHYLRERGRPEWTPAEFVTETERSAQMLADINHDHRLGGFGRWTIVDLLIERDRVLTGFLTELERPDPLPVYDMEPEGQPVRWTRLAGLGITIVILALLLALAVASILKAIESVWSL